MPKTTPAPKPAGPARTIEMDCFVSGIVKGIAEQGSAYAHFGSLMNFNGHLYNAKALGVVAEDGRTLTELGRRYYQVAALDKLPGGRAYMWTEQAWQSLFEAAQA